MMTFRTRHGKPIAQMILDAAGSARRDGSEVSRREFMSLAMTFGASAATAYAMLGLPRPAAAKTATPQRGGSVKIQMPLPPLKDTRVQDLTQAANFTAGWLETLLQYENDGTFTPYLIEDWEVSDDARTYTFMIRPGVQWNNGTPFTAEDLAFNFARWADARVEGSVSAQRLAAMIDPDTSLPYSDAIEILDPMTVRINLQRPDITILPTLAEYNCAVVPQDHSFETMLTHPVGTGAYLPETYDTGIKAVLVRNENHAWWDAGNGAWMDRIEYLDFGADQSTYIRAMEDGEIDAVYTISGDFVDAFEQIEGLSRHDIVTSATVVVRPNALSEVNGIRPYEDVRVRRALALATDNNVLFELGFGARGLVAENHHVCPVHPEYNAIEQVAHDPEEAARLMAEAGMADFEHEIITLDDDWIVDTAMAVSAQLRDAGIKARVTIRPAATFWNAWKEYPFSLTFWGHRPFGVQVLNEAYRSDAVWNETGFANEEFDRLVVEALGTGNVETRKEIVGRLQQIMIDEAVTIQPYWRGLTNFTKADLHGAGQHITFNWKPQYFFWSA